VIDHGIGPRGNHKITWDTLQCSAFAKLRMRPIYIRARNFRLKREQISSIYTASYGWFRVYFSALSRLLIRGDLLHQEDDIYYISWQDVRMLLEKPEKATEIQTLIAARRDEIEKSRDITLPEIIYGNVTPPLSLTKSDAKKVNGIPTSPGYFQGRLKVIRSGEDFEKVRQGDVIAVPYSDVAWTPLFAKAGAVIAEAGGILSHSSIIAREYGIPCVVSVNGACNLPENIEVIVDGYQGVILIVS
jgi:phosphohistidine swiveling domain-containing protein